MLEHHSTANHETVPTIQINYYIVEHVKKKNCAPMREKPHILGQLPFHLTRLHVYCDELHEEKCTLKTGGYTCVPHTIMEVCSLKEH